MKILTRYSRLSLAPILVGLAVWLWLSPMAMAQSAADVQATLDNIWVLIAAILVIFMNAGFAMVETGFCRRKNAVNILAKNLIVFALATLAFWATGFAWMFGEGSPLIGNGDWFLAGTPENYGFRVSTQQELLGLDISEHENIAYWGFSQYKENQNQHGS